MTELPPDELAALPDDIRPGTLVLELGNKKNSTGLYRDWYLANGLDYVSLDWNGLDGALRIDMRVEGVWQRVLSDCSLHPEERFRVVTNFGFTEHVGNCLEEQIECWRNVHNLVDEGGYLAMCMPMMPDWKGHGLWMPDTRWYASFAQQNMYVMNLQIWDRKRRTIVVTMKKLEHCDFLPPLEGKILRSD